MRSASRSDRGGGAEKLDSFVPFPFFLLPPHHLLTSSPNFCRVPFTMLAARNFTAARQCLRSVRVVPSFVAPIAQVTGPLSPTDGSINWLTFVCLLIDPRLCCLCRRCRRQVQGPEGLRCTSSPSEISFFFSSVPARAAQTTSTDKSPCRRIFHKATILI